METAISPSGNYKVVIELVKVEHPVERNVKLMDKDGKIIYEYTQIYSTSPCNQFVTINGQEWWIGGREYQLKLLVNCETGQIFDDPDNKEKNLSSTEFIWGGNFKISPNGHFLLVVGCMWSFPYEWRLYDIRNMTLPNLSEDEKEEIEDEIDAEDGIYIRNISLYKYLVIESFSEDDERHRLDEEESLEDDEVFNYNFISDTEIEITYWTGTEHKYYNTIDLTNVRAKKTKK